MNNILIRNFYFFLIFIIMTQTIKVLNRNYLNHAEGTPVETTSVANIFRIQGTAVFVGSNLIKEVVVEDTISVGTAAPSATEVQPEFSVVDFLNMMNPTGLTAHPLTAEEAEAVQYVRSHVRGLTINVGDSYRYYTRSTNRWDLARFEMTGTDIGRIVSGFAIKSPSRKSAKRKLLTALNTVYGLVLSADEIQASVNN